MLEARPYKWLWMPATWLMTLLLPAFIMAFASAFRLIDEATFRQAGPALIGLTPLIGAVGLFNAAVAAKAGKLTRLGVIGIFCGVGLSFGAGIILFLGLMGLFFAILFGLSAGTDAGTTTVQFVKAMIQQYPGMGVTVVFGTFSGAVVGAVAAFTAFRRRPGLERLAKEEEASWTADPPAGVHSFGQRRR